MYINSKLQVYLDEIQANVTLHGHNVYTKEAERIASPVFFELDGCVLLDQGTGDELPAQFSPDAVTPDRTAFEAQYNHLHLTDYYTDPPISPIGVFSIGVELVAIWTTQLKQQFSGRRQFVIVLSFDGEETVLRFFTRRFDEPVWADIAGIEKYIDGVMIVEVE
ncbi:hypothetical protein [Paenibacillus ihuae]|uniref:hypothetical protein n=1 Tax=Paenibacillus ihuae TaxID=1232431 RepID=UPI0006D5577F|nr:hypothetical protein [Paenibacillus ihuae]